MTNKAFVEEKARDLAAFEDRAQSLAMSNTAGLSHVDRIKLAADARIAADRAEEARSAYRRAFAVWRANDFRD